ncbi:MAG: NlpC/P60 family protein [Flavisolibacter sp.]|nr:NlpC/P60 family protein [Flavisolibacter sp.]
MKYIIITLLIIFAGWKAAVFLMNKNADRGSVPLTDSLVVKQPLVADSINGHTKADTGKLDANNKNSQKLYQGKIDTRKVQPQHVVDFAKTLIGIPYLYGSTDPAKGFDCSGFITYVFNHFDIAVPRSSIDFTNVGSEVSDAGAKPGDIILFNGTDSLEKFVGHMGIVVSNTDSLYFIHSTSGKKYGVTITSLGEYYKKRYVKTVRIFP